MFCKNDVLRNFTRFTGKHLCQSLFFNKVNFIKKETLAQVFFCEFYEISKNTFFKEHLWTTASVNSCFSIIFSIFNKLKILCKDCLIDLSVSKNLSIQHAMYFYLKTEKHFSKHCLFISANHFSRSSF